MPSMVAFSSTKTRQLYTLQALVDKHLRFFEVVIDRCNEALGLTVISRDGSTLLIGQVTEGPLARWNRQTKSEFQRVFSGDSIVSVNGVSGAASRLVDLVKGKDVLTLRIRRREGAINLEEFGFTDCSSQPSQACHLSMALDCLNFYQQNRRGGTLRAKGTFDKDPRTCFVELLKLWLGRYAGDYSVDPTTCEVNSFIKLCSDVCRFPRLFPQSNKHSFIMTIAQVAGHLRAYLNVRGALAWATVSGDDVCEASVARRLWGPEDDVAPRSSTRPDEGDRAPTPEEATTASEGGSAADSSEMELPDPMQAKRGCPGGHPLESTTAWCKGYCDVCHSEVAEGESVESCTRCPKEWWLCATCQDWKIVDELPALSSALKQHHALMDSAQDSAKDFQAEHDDGFTISRSSSCVSLSDEIVVDPETLLDTE